MRTTEPPKWASDYLSSVYRLMGYSEKPPALTWANARPGTGTGGRAWYPGYYYLYGRIHLTADELDIDGVLRTLLHEIAHVRNPKAHHGPVFWDTCWKLYIEFGMDTDKCLEEEAGYKEESIRAARRAGVIPGSDARRLVSERRKRLAQARKQDTSAE